MNISEAIVKYGTEAVLHYRSMAGFVQDNEIPETFLGGSIASGLHEALKVQAHVNRFYTVIASELGKTLDLALVNKISGHRADIAIYQDGRPAAIVELKVFDEGNPSCAAIVADRDKVARLAGLCGVEGYLGILITDVSSATCMERTRSLEKVLEREFDVIGDKQLSVRGAWSLQVDGFNRDLGGARAYPRVTKCLFGPP